MVTNNGTSKAKSKKATAAEDSKPTLDWREFELDETDEYDVFERMPGNRPIDEEHVVRLMKLIKEKDLKVPIQINENLEIIDGQHRLEARRRLKLPVPYFVTSGFGLHEVQKLNAGQKRWSVDDYVDSFIELGNENYKIYRHFRKKYNLPHNQTMTILAGRTDSHNLRQNFINGQLKIQNLSRAYGVADRLSQIEKYFPKYWNNARFIQAMLFVMNKKGFDFDRFMQKLEKWPNILKPQADSEKYIMHIEEIYNYRTRDQVNLRFGEDID